MEGSDPGIRQRHGSGQRPHILAGFGILQVLSVSCVLHFISIAEEDAAGILQIFLRNISCRPCRKTNTFADSFTSCLCSRVADHLFSHIPSTLLGTRLLEPCMAVHRQFEGRFQVNVPRLKQLDHRGGFLSVSFTVPLWLNVELGNRCATRLECNLGPWPYLECFGGIYSDVSCRPIAHALGREELRVDLGTSA